MRKIWILASMLMLLTACGFRLRQEVALPPALQTLRIESADPYSGLSRDLSLALERTGAKIVETADVPVLRIVTDRLESVPLTVGESGRVQEYEVRYRVEFEVTGTATVPSIARQQVALSRDYAFDTAQSLGSPGEAEIIQQELRREMVQTILRRIEAASRSAVSPSS